MTKFVAYNVEPEEYSEDELDDTKEIQIEEALKLYQAALKLHSQELYDEAAVAYDNLFASDIFTYPESLPQAERLELYDENEAYDGATSLSQRADMKIQNSAIDGAPSTLAQLLYLSYKNHGLFLLDVLTKHIQQDSQSIERDGISNTILPSLRRLIQALHRDDTELELWRKVARICESMGSTRIARYCLETVLAADRDGSDPWWELLSIDQVFAAEQLKVLLTALRDTSWETKLATLPGSHKQVVIQLQKYIDPCPYLSHQPQAILGHNSRENQSRSGIEWQSLKIEMRSWGSCGKSIMYQICQEDQGMFDAGGGAKYRILLPNKQISSNQEKVQISEEKGLALTIKGSNDKSTSQVGNYANPEADSRAVKNVDEKLSKEPAAHAPIESDNDDQDGEATASNIPGVMEDSGPAHAVEVISKNPHKEESDTMYDQEFQVGAPTPAQEPSRSLGAISKMPAMVSLPTRKRSSDSAGMQDTVDMGRVRSKRIKARGSTNEPGSSKEALAEELNQLYQDQLQVIDQVDNLLFEVAGRILSKFNVEYPGSFGAFKEIISSALANGSLRKTVFERDPSNVAAQDFLSLLAAWDKEKLAAFLHGDDDNLGGSSNLSGPRNSGLNLFLEHSKRGSAFASQKSALPEDQGLEAFALKVEQTWTSLDELALKWVEALVAPLRTEGGDDLASRYEAFLWPESLKRTIVLMLVMKDEYIYGNLCSRLTRLDERLLETITCPKFDGLRGSEKDLIRTVQNIFELHLDIYGKIVNPSSEVDSTTRILQLHRLRRWAALAYDAISKKPCSENSDELLDHLDIRFLWASVLHTGLLNPTSRDHIILCFQDLSRMLKEAGSPVIELPNNYMMPEISVEAAEREISRVTTMDFFLNLFNNQESDPLTVIEGLEPILEGSVQMQDSLNPDERCVDKSDPANDTQSTTGPSSEKSPDIDSEQFFSPDMKQMLQFVGRANVSLKIILWEKLGEAYEAITYPPKVLCCTLRRIEIITEYLVSESYAAKHTSDRYLSLLRWLRVIGSLVTKALNLVLNELDIFHFLDEAHLRRVLNATVYLQRILYVQMLWEDSIRIGKVQPTRLKGLHEEFESAMNNIRALLVKIWLLQYTLMKEAFKQNRELAKDAKQDMSEYLKCLHGALGLRRFCNVSKRLFPIFMKGELLQLIAPESSCISTAQLIYDLYGLKICSNPSDLEDHGCQPAPLDRDAALEIMDLVMVQVRKMNIKDIGKSELRNVIDKMQQAIRVPKPTGAMVFNRRVITAFLGSPINPVDLFRSLRGVGDLSGTAVNNFYSLSNKGWYLLLGHLTLAKSRSQKRVFPGPVEDLEMAKAYFRHDLELGLEKWETWYRLAQVFDAMIEENTTWSAEKLNTKMTDLISLQRNAIHCYTMAVAVANRDDDASFEAAEKISELYADFACRIYASSREPFSMKAFTLQEFIKHYNGEARGMYQGPPFREMRVYSAWKFASVLFQRAKSESWINYYMLGKCLWKMHNCEDEIRGKARHITYTEVLDAFTRAIELLPERRDSKHSEKDPILEPHYKLVSIVHKLVQSKKIQPGEGCRYLKATWYARKHPPVKDLEDWEGYLIHVLKSLRSADKANWHHRMVARAAHAIYDDSPDEYAAALGAKHELTQQIFTKTMHTQIWRPDNERPGRHFVYTSRYVSFFVRILSKLSDRNNLEALARRVRKKSGDFFNHAKVWEEVCTAYLKLLRRLGQADDGKEDTVFKNLPHTTFLLNADRLEAWAQSATTTPQNLETLREAVELKKLNANLMKPGPIEDLVGDIYAHLYDSIVPDLVTKSNTEENRVRMRVDHVLMDPAAEKIPPPDDKLPDPVPPVPKQVRAKFVSKREVQRKAESLVLAKSVVPPPVLKSRSSSNPKILAAVEIPEVPGRVDGSGDLTTMRGREDGGKDVGSIPGSLHDSADDESELSDVEEMMEDVEPGPRILFPGLMAGRDMKTGGDEEREEEEENEEEEVEGGEEEKGKEEGEEEQEEEEVEVEEGIKRRQEEEEDEEEVVNEDEDEKADEDHVNEIADSEVDDEEENNEETHSERFDDDLANEDQDLA